MKFLQFGKKKQKSTRAKIFKLMVVPAALILSVLLLFFISDDFWTLAQLHFFGAKDGRTGILNTGSSGYGWGSESDITGGSVSSGGGSGGFSAGGSNVGSLNMALINKMNAGFYKDYLEIAKVHCSWEAMPSEVAQINSSSGPWTPPVSYIVGSSMTETGLYTAKKQYAPRTSLQPDRYDELEGYNLYDATSDWFKEHGPSYIDSHFSYNILQMATPPDGDGAIPYHTQFQCTLDFFSKYADGTVQGSNKYPSKMNPGHGIDELNGGRTTTDTDAFYFPDQLAVYMQSSLGRFEGRVDTSKLDSNYLGALSFIPHNGGGNMLSKCFAIGVSATQGPPSNDIAAEYGYEAATDALVHLCNMLDKASAFIGEHHDEIDLLWNNHADYEGLSAVLLLSGGDGFIVSEGSMKKLRSRCESDVAYSRGALLGLRIARNDMSLTGSDLMDFVNSLSVVKLGPDYSDVYTDTTASVDVCVMSKTCNVVYPGKTNSVPACHRYQWQPLRGVFMIALGGSHLFYKMLQMGGVDCTYDEVVQNGDELISQLPSFDLNTSEIGKKIALYGTMIAWGDQQNTAEVTDSRYVGMSPDFLGHQTWGTALYRYLCNKLEIGTPQRSCDAGVASVILWSGADTSFYRHSCTAIMQDLDSKVLQHLGWITVPGFDGTKNTVSALQPGDVLVKVSDYKKHGVYGSGYHIILYVGRDAVKQVYPGLSGDYDLMHSSIGALGPSANNECDRARSPNLANAAAEIGVGNGYEAYRCVVPTPSDKYASILTEAEVKWLHNHPFENDPTCSFTTEEYYRNGTPIHRVTNSIPIPQRTSG